MASGLEQITASAGSGKTYTLTRRFLRHLAGALPDGGPALCLLRDSPTSRSGSVPYSLGGILAATFTNKAAAEMQARVIRELKQQALAKDGGDPNFPLTPDQARRWVEVILRRFDAVNIRTIDSLLNLLVRLNSLTLSLPPDFTPLFSLDEAILPLYDALLDQADRDPGGTVANLFREACRSLLFHHRAKGIAAGDILRRRLREVIDLRLGGADLPTREHGEKATAMLIALHAGLTDAASALAAFTRDENLSVNANARKFLDKCCEIPPLTVPDFTSSYAQKACLDDWLNKGSRGMASGSAEAAFRDLCASWAMLAELGPALVTTREYMPLVALAETILDGLDTMQREEGVVPATRLPTLALESLEFGNGVSDAFCRLGDSLVHLLFDEFQDTSTDQWRAILPLVEECLSHGGSLTYVGDVKQAIYGWRGGNAELFDSVARDERLTAMLENGAETTTLSHNWRSTPAIVHTNNRVFGQLADPAFARRILGAMLPDDIDPGLFARTAEVLAASFAECRQAVPEKNRAKDGYVRLVKLEERYTSQLMERVRGELRSLLLEDVLVRRSPGEVAILVRKNSEAAEIADWLAEWQVPVVTEHSFRLGNHPLITRLVDTLTFLEYPMDDTAFWSAVSGPELFGPDFSAPNAPGQENLMDWLAETRELPSTPPLYALFRNAFPEVWARTLSPFHDRTGLLGAYDMACELIRHCRLFERFPEHAPFLRRFIEVAYAAENKGFSSLSAFLDYWAQTGVGERVPMPETMDAVRILSMHKAKGLEFPVVIVPFHHQADPLHKPLAVDDSSGIPLITYRENSTAEAIRGTVEQINLLYVAWTRPTEEMYAFITQTGHSASRSSLGKALEALLEDTPFIGNVFCHGKTPEPDMSGPETPPPDDSGAKTTRGGSTLDDPAQEAPESQPPAPLMSWLPRLKIFRNPVGEKGFSERQRGLLAHACLEALRLTGETEADISRAVDQGLRAFPVPMPDPEGVRRDMRDMFVWYASLPEAARWMRHGSPEQSIMDVDGSLRRVDLLVDAPGLPLLAVEYKTGQPSDEHIAQVERYISLLAESLRRKEPERAVTGIVVYLDQRKLLPVSGTALEALP